ncbi:MAG TPA: transglycosylase domain-containing protein, partial [Patescibacteria group bacterium]|nr:transglycosylase domain-containing protein [Patescibacteria group bacterium]
MDFRRSRRSRYSSRIFFFSNLTRLAFFGLIGIVLLTIFLFIFYSRDLPTPGKLSSSNLSQSTRILDRNGIVLYDIYGDQNRTYVELKDIPKAIQEATIATEDKDFYRNQGFSVTGFLR